MSDKPKKGVDEATTAGGVPIYVVQKRSKTGTLRQLKGPGAPRDVPLELDEIVIGRAQDAHLQIDSTSVSRQHAAVRRSESGFSLVDLGSANGIFVNSERIERAELRDGDSVQIGDALFLYRESD